MKKLIIIILPIVLYLGACGENNETMQADDDIDPSKKASVVSVSVTGSESSYTFNVGIKSTETGCNQYANWWEVITEDGVLLYRRILAHSHVNEQPFVRSGGTINITANQTVIIRAHMNTSGYGSEVFKGSVTEGFIKTTLAIDFANELSSQAPLPNGCAF